MTTPHDEIDRYLASGNELSSLYHSDNQPAPGKLDKNILDYAHNAVSVKKSKSANLWWPMAMAASVIIGIITLRAFDNPTPGMDTTVMATNEATNISVPQTASDQITDSTRPIAATETLAAKPELQPVPASQPASQVASQPVQQAEAKKLEPRQAKNSAVPKSVKNKKEPQLVTKATNDNPLLTPVTSTLGEADPKSTQVWFEKIEKMFADGKTKKAQQELVKFLKKNPQHEAALKLKKQHLPE